MDLIQGDDDDFEEEDNNELELQCEGFEVEELDEQEEDNEQEAHPLITRHTERNQAKNKPKVVRASIKFTLPDENGNDVEYLGLFDTGSTHGLISEELVKKHNLNIIRQNI